MSDHCHLYVCIYRYTTTFGVDASYKGQTMAMYDRAPRRIPDTLQTLLDAVSEATGDTFNFVLMNFYEDGKHSISYHSDDEKFLGIVHLHFRSTARASHSPSLSVCACLFVCFIRQNPAENERILILIM